ncbi:tripartite motif-containing protein 2-like [Babylonia areolata]|uniref:tripartite motif-containing protein 2-like n=1 Tax=Babylonia areolata TaxID=304850 RepID=UPI003FD44A58
MFPGPSMQVPLPVTKECGLCLETSPRILPCSHRFCLACLRHILPSQSQSQGVGHSTSFPCPTCRSPTSIPPGGIQDFQSCFQWEEVRSGRTSLAMSGCSGVCGRAEEARKKEEEEERGRIRSGSRTSPDKDKRPAQDRACALHPGNVLVFYCTCCSTPVCRDCKLTAHEGHPAINLFEKSSEVKTLVTLVTDMSRDTLATQLRQTLQKAENHRQSVRERRKKILATLTRRADCLREVVDQSLQNAIQHLEVESAQLDAQVSATVDGMTQGLVILLSHIDYVQEVVRNGCDADVVDLLPSLEKFFTEASQHDTEPFEILDTDAGCVSGSMYSLDGTLRSFLTDDWKVDLELSDSAPVQECPFCTFKFSQRTSTCPNCCPGGGRGSSKKKTTTARNIFGRKCKSSSPVSGPQLQCRNCSFEHNATFNFCPHCGTPTSQDALTSIKAVIPQYIGHVSQKHQSKRQEEGQGSGSRSRPRRAEEENITTTAAHVRRIGPEGAEILNTVSTIASILQGKWA